jgi:hypothetical protein
MKSLQEIGLKEKQQ